MIREVNLVEYLPPFMQSYTEPVAALETENHEFAIMWKAVDRVLCNRFISIADEYGISQFEKMLGITPNADDTLDFRRAVVKSKWCNQMPYTEKGLKEKLAILCGNEEDFIYEIDANSYILKIKIALVKKNMVNEVLNILEQMIPENMQIEVELLYNTHEMLAAYKYGDLGNYTYGKLRDEVI